MPVVWTLVAIVALLGAAHASQAVYRWAFADGGSGELSRRIRTWWIIALPLAGALVLGAPAVTVVFALASFVALKEFVTLSPDNAADRKTVFWAYVTVPWQYLWVWIELYSAFLVYVPVYVFAFFSLRILLGGGAQNFTARIGRLFWGIMATVYSLSHAAYLWHLGPKIGAPAGGAGLVLFLLLLVQFNDVAQFCCGKLLGGPKIAPRVSPGKTWSGLIGGVFVTTALAYLLGPLLTPFGDIGAAGAGALIALSGFVGDIVVSAVKRDAGVKDAGHILPGHGGILDRVDSLLLAAPLFFHFVRYLYVPGDMP